MFCYVYCACYTCSAASQQSTTVENFLLGNKYFVTSTSTSTLHASTSIKYNKTAELAVSERVGFKSHLDQLGLAILHW